MGVVYRARHRKLGHIVALKVIGHGAPTSEDARKRFEREAATAAALDHPHIVPVYESGEDGGRLFIAMKLIEGESLEMLRPPAKGRAAWAAVLIEKVARAVEHAHERGVVHRDLKPANILVSTEGEPHVADFGLARTVTEDESSRARASSSGLSPPDSRRLAIAGFSDVAILSIDATRPHPPLEDLWVGKNHERKVLSVTFDGRLIPRGVLRRHEGAHPCTRLLP